MNFLGSSSSFASTPASNGSSLNGLSSFSGAGSSSPPKSPKPASSAGSEIGSAGAGAGAAGAGASIFSLYFVSSLTSELFFLIHLLVKRLIC